MVPVVLSIAGSDSSGGAGIQADIRACQKSGVYCATVITAVTAQNPYEVSAIQYVGDEMLRSQLDTTLNALKPDAVKIGMIPCVSAVRIIADTIRKYKLGNVIIDPVLSATSGAVFTTGSYDSQQDFIGALKDSLFPLSTLVTPNIPEYEKLFGTTYHSGGVCSKILEDCHLNALLIKGGHGEKETCEDILIEKGCSPVVFRAERIDTTHTHGTGCTLSSAIAANLAKGNSLQSAVSEAKNLVIDCIQKATRNPLYTTNSPLLY